jgi:hypothetical protein
MQNKTLMATKESKKIVKMYNKVAKALIEFEALWHQAWLRSIEQCKAGLAAPLLVQHPNTGKLLVRVCVFCVCVLVCALCMCTCVCECVSVWTI